MDLQLLTPRGLLLSKDMCVCTMVLKRKAEDVSTA